MKAKQVAVYGILTALMLALGLLERQFILVPGVPGIKLGLSNVALLYALCLLGAKGAWALMALKVLLGGLLYAGATGMLYALAGGILSMAAMTVTLYTRKMGFTGVSVAGAVCHVTGQVLASRLILGTWAAAAQLPLLLAASAATGVLTGVAAGMTCRALAKTDRGLRKRLETLRLDAPPKQN